MRRVYPFTWNVALLLAAATIYAAPARADVTLCNASDAPITLASAYLDEAGTPRSAVGLGPLGPTECHMFFGADEANPVYYIYIEGLAPPPGSVRFCLRAEPDFYITQAEPCTGPGDQMVDYAKFSQPDAAQSLVLNLDGRGGFLPAPNLPMIDASLPFQPKSPAAQADLAGGAGGGAGASGEIAVTGAAAGGGARIGSDRDATAVAEGDDEGAFYDSGLAPGSYGPSFELSGTWDGCFEGGAGLECHFHAMFTRFVIRDGEAYPPNFLPALAQISSGTEASVIGDVLADGGFEVEVALASVKIAADSPFIGLYHALQGVWVSEDDPDYQLHVAGSEITPLQSGQPEGVIYFALGQGCGGQTSDVPTITTLAVETGDELCAAFDSLTDDRLVLIYDGVPMALHRP